MHRNRSYRTPGIEGIYRKDLKRYSLPSLEEADKIDLVQRAKQGDREATDLLVRSHIMVLDLR